VTTIVANLEYMVSDSRVSIAEKGFAYPATKIVKSNGIVFGASGEGGDCSAFLEWGRKGFKEKDQPKWKTPHYSEDEIVGLILKPDGLYIWTQGGPEAEKINADFFAIGSGGKAARVALMLGTTLEEAVEYACKVDEVFSAPPLQVLRLVS